MIERIKAASEHKRKTLATVIQEEVNTSKNSNMEQIFTKLLVTLADILRL